jgi:tRNA(fMet)-specific endonuclease VapC
VSRICLDTSAYSQFRRSHPAAAQQIRRAREIIVPVIALGELRIGFRLGDRETENETSLAEFLGEPFVKVADVDEEASDLYADLASEMRQAGRAMRSNDIWIASIALREGATVLTFDEHFRSIPRVDVTILKP